MYVIHRDPKNAYESFVERFCLRKRKGNPHAEKRRMVADAASAWRSEFGKNKQKLDEFLKLQAGEKPFVRYESYLNHINTRLTIASHI